jgi:hypothetical protein
MPFPSWGYNNEAAAEEERTRDNDALDVPPGGIEATASQDRRVGLTEPSVASSIPKMSEEKHHLNDRE